MGLNTTPRTWVDSEVVTALELNTEVRDALTGIQAAWTSYTPALTNITKNNGVTSCAYMQIGKLIWVRFRFAAGSTTTYSAGTLGISAPVTPNAIYTTGASQDHGVGSAIVLPASRQGATVVFATTAGGVFNFVVDNLASTNIVTNTIPGTFSTTSVISGEAFYEAA